MRLQHRHHYAQDRASIAGAAAEAGANRNHFAEIDRHLGGNAELAQIRARSTHRKIAFGIAERWKIASERHLRSGGGTDFTRDAIADGDWNEDGIELMVSVGAASGD